MTETAEKVDLSKATPVAWLCTDAYHSYIRGIVTTSPETVQAWREDGIEFVPLVPDYAVNERDELIKALEFYRDGFAAKVPKKPRYPGDISSITYEPTEALLDDCGNRALAILERVSK